MSDPTENLEIPEKYRIRVSLESNDFAVGTYDHTPRSHMAAALDHLGELGYEVMFLGKADANWVVTFKRAKGARWKHEHYDLEANGFDEQRLSTINEKAVRSGSTVIYYTHPDNSRHLVIKSRVYDAIVWP